MKARCMTTLPPGDQNEFVSAVPLPDTVSKSIQAFVQESLLFAALCIEARTGFQSEFVLL